MHIGTKHNDDDRLPQFVTGRIGVGTITESLRIDVQGEEDFLCGCPDSDTLSERTLSFVRDKIELYVQNNQIRHGHCSQLRASMGLSGYW